MVGGDSECREVEPWGHRYMVGGTVSVERWNRGGAQTYGGGDSECREVEPWGCTDIWWRRQLV